MQRIPEPWEDPEIANLKHGRLLSISLLTASTIIAVGLSWALVETSLRLLGLH